MKLREYSRNKARNFLISWSLIYFFFSLMVIWFLTFGVGAQADPRMPPSVLWPHWILLAVILFSLLLGIVGMWKKYHAGEFDRMRAWRNIPFYLVLLIYPLGIIINLLTARFG